MVFGKLIKENKITINRAVIFFGAILLYVFGFFSQFSWLGWTVTEFFYAPAIVMLFYALLSQLKDSFFTLLIIKLGALSYSFFLMHNFFAQFLSGYFGNGLMSFWKTIIVSTVCSLILALLIEKLVPLFSKAFSSLWAVIDSKLVA